MASNSFRYADAKAVAKAIGECCEIGRDPVLWRLHLFQRAGELVNADIVTGGEITGLAGLRKGDYAPLRFLGTADWGWHRGFSRAPWERRLAEFRKCPTLPPPLDAFFLRYLDGASECEGRERFLNDAEWARSSWRSEYLQPCGVDALALCIAPAPGTDDDHVFMNAFRARGCRPFRQRERHVLAALSMMAASLAGRALGRFGNAEWPALTPRQRDVLHCVLDGDSDKLIALRLEMSRNTVNAHMKAIFRRFGVGSRGQLIARAGRRDDAVGRQPGPRM